MSIRKETSRCRPVQVGRALPAFIGSAGELRRAEPALLTFADAIDTKETPTKETI